MKIALVTAIAALALGVAPAFAAESDVPASREVSPLAHARLVHPDVGAEGMPDFGPYDLASPPAVAGTATSGYGAAGRSATGGSAPVDH